ncbi:YeaC family protein [Photobacterium kagoshimensis]|uniref:YeaC family protein n=1 Tax=Photobacterium kagoshimensis TaxID=2910242 RepID=UPI003D0D4E03
MDVEQILHAMTPEVYQRLMTAVEVGKWPDGTVLTQEQRDATMQAVMLYQSRNNQDAEHMSVELGGEIKFKSKAELKRDFGINEEAAHSTDDIARFNHSEL